MFKHTIIMFFIHGLLCLGMSIKQGNMLNILKACTSHVCFFFILRSSTLQMQIKLYNYKIKLQIR